MKSTAPSSSTLPGSTNIRKDPLYIAVKSGNLTDVQRLVELRTEIDLIDERGKTLLHKAIIEGGMNSRCFEVAVYLINKGSKDKFHQGYTALHLAALNCIPSILKAFADNNHDFTITTNDAFKHNVIELILKSRNTKDMMLKSLMTIPQDQKDILLEESKIDKKSLDTNAAKAFENFQKIFIPQTDISNLIVPAEEKKNLYKEVQMEYTLATKEDLTNFHISEFQDLLGDTF